VISIKMIFAPRRNSTLILPKGSNGRGKGHSTKTLVVMKTRATYRETANDSESEGN